MSDVEYEVQNSRIPAKPDDGYERFGTDPINFYRFLTPQDELGRVRIFNKKRTSENDPTIDKYKILFDTYIKTTTSGRKIIDILKVHSTQLPYSGVGFQTAAIDSTGKATFLDREYWVTKSVKPSVSEPGAGQEITAENYYQNICTTDGDEPGIDVTLNVLRMPFLSNVRKNVDSISLFLNHIPSHFASQMVPYLDVEFQMPRLTNDTIKNSDGKITGRYLNRPSIIRFLLGSLPPPREEIQNGQGTGNFYNLLSDADSALISTLNVSKPHQVNPKTAPGAVQNTQEVFITGMEMFTSPQTLTNMQELKARSDARLFDAKPFLPPATLTSVGMTVLNAGAINSPNRTATLEFKVHDKSRLTEFSEFVRGQSGSADITIWITFGWLGPRGSNVAENNAYAKFVNETMLERFAFMTKNVGYSFDNTGQAVVKLDLISKAVATMEQGKIDVMGSSNTSVFRQLPIIMAEIRQLRNALNSKSTAAQNAFASLNVGTENRIAQVIEAVEAGNLEPTIPPDELIKILKEEGKRIKSEQPVNDKALRLINLLITLFEIDPTEKIPVWKVQQKKEARDFAKSRFDSFRKEGEDPFLPTDSIVKREGQPDQRLFSEDLVKTLYNYGEECKPKEQPAPPTPAKGGGGGKGYGGGGGGKGYGGGGGGGGKKQEGGFLESLGKVFSDCGNLANAYRSAKKNYNAAFNNFNVINGELQQLYIQRSTAKNAGDYETYNSFEMPIYNKEEQLKPAKKDKDYYKGQMDSYRNAMYANNCSPTPDQIDQEGYG